MIFSNFSHSNSFGCVFNDAPMYTAEELNIVDQELISLYETLGSPINNDGDFI